MKDILDVKGLIMHSFFRCKDSGSPYRGARGQQVATAEAAFTTFLESYIIPLIDNGSAPIDILAVWEGGNIRRKQIFPKYKANRDEKEKDEVVEQQLDKLYNYVKSFLLGIGATNVVTDTVEADDTVAYLSKCREGCCVYTVDHDLVQLQSDTCQVIIKGDYVGEDDTFLDPELVSIYKAIVGDSSDNYGGIKGIGKDRGWPNLLRDYGKDGLLELRDIGLRKDRREMKLVMDDLGESASKELQTIASNFSNFCLMIQLAELHPEWCQSVYKRRVIRPDWHRRVPNEDRVDEILERTGNMDLKKYFKPFMPVTVLVTRHNVDDILYSGTFLDDLNVRPVAFDYETYDENRHPNYAEASKRGVFVDVLSQRITGAAFTWGRNYEKTIYITVNHKDSENNCELSVIEDMIEACNALVVQNSQFEETVTYSNIGEHLRDKLFGKLADTRIFSSYRDENEPTGLKDQSLRWLNYKQVSYKELMAACGVDPADGMRHITSEQVLNYGADDGIVTAHLAHMNALILDLEQTADFMFDNEFITNSVFTQAFIEGCNIDLDQLYKMKEADSITLEESYTRLREILAENCKEENIEAADAYMSEIKPFEVASMREAGKTDKEISNKLQEKRDKFLAATRYEEWVEEYVPYAFLPTVAQFRKIFLKICPALEQEWDGEGDDPRFLNTVAPTKLAEEYATKKEHIDPDLHDLIGLILQAAHQFKAREGDEYDKLVAYVQEIMKDEGKVRTSGDELNFDSPVQSAALLYGKLGLPIRHRSKVDADSKRDRLGFAGAPSSNNKAMEIALAEDCPEGSWRREVLELVIKIKSLETQFKFYYNPYPHWVNPDTGKIHPSCINCGTVTRRPAGSSPNILQVKKGPIRSIYLPPRKGHVWVAPDFSGQELRLLASESKDPVLLDAYLSDNPKDVHSLTASAIMPKIAVKKRPDIYKHIEYEKGKPAQLYDQFNAWLEDKDSEFGEFAKFVRNKRAKGVNFLVNYEGGAGTLSTNLLVPQDEAQEFIDGMFELYEMVPVFQEESHKLAATHGYVATAYGNRRHMTDDISARDDGKRMRMERQASNFRIQGCAADILKVVVAECHRSGLLEETESILIAPVYDEVLCSVPEDRVVEFCQRLQKIMDLTPPGHKVPMVSEFSVGFDWYNMVEIGVDTSEENVLKCVEESREKRKEFKEAS